MDGPICGCNISTGRYITTPIDQRLTGFFCSFSKYEAIVRYSAWSFGHSDPDPSSV